MGVVGLEGRAPTPSDEWDARRRGWRAAAGARVGAGRPGRGESPPPAPIVRPGGGGAAGLRSRAREVEPRAAGSGACVPSSPGSPPPWAPRGCLALRGDGQAPERKREGDGARRPARVPQAPEPRGTAGRGAAGRGARAGAGPWVSPALQGLGARLLEGERPGGGEDLTLPFSPRTLHQVPAAPPSSHPDRGSLSEREPPKRPGHGQRSDPAARGRLPPPPGD